MDQTIELDTELIDEFCLENEKSYERMIDRAESNSTCHACPRHHGGSEALKSSRRHHVVAVVAMQLKSSVPLCAVGA